MSQYKYFPQQTMTILIINNYIVKSIIVIFIIYNNFLFLLNTIYEQTHE